MIFLVGALISLAAVFLHYEGLRFLAVFVDRRQRGHRHDMWIVMVGVILLHLLEALVYAVLYWLRTNVFQVDHFNVGHLMQFWECFNFSLETYTTIGYGDVYLRGDARFLSGLESLIGMVLIGWSASFILLILKDRWDKFGPKALK